MAKIEGPSLELLQHDRVSESALAGGRACRSDQHGAGNLAMFVRGLVALGNALVRTIRIQLGCEPLHGQVVGQQIADVVQEEEARRGEEGDDRA